MDFQYGGGDTCFNYCGAGRGNTIIQTATIWSIPVGYFFAMIGLNPYHVTTVGIAGAFVVIIGVVLVLSKPADLFNLRKM